MFWNEQNSTELLCEGAYFLTYAWQGCTSSYTHRDHRDELWRVATCEGRLLHLRMDASVLFGLSTKIQIQIEELNILYIVV